jgi:phospholipase/carboxylesterase
MSAESLLSHRVLMPDNAGPSQHPTLILLHGRGADEEDLLGLVPMLDERLLVLSVRAPIVWNEGGGYTWYDVGQIGVPEGASFMSSYNELQYFVQGALERYPINKDRLFLLGFSMGAVMSLAMGLTHPELFRGIAAHSGYVPEGTPLALTADTRGSTDFLVLHGTEDPVIPIMMAHRAKEFLRGAGVRFQYHEYPIGHQISEESLTTVREWMQPLIEGT